MSFQHKPILKDPSIEQINDLIIESIQDIKGENIVCLDLRNLEDRPTDFFIICEAESSTKIGAIATNIHQRLKNEALLTPSHFEGKTNGKWVLLDYFYTVVHVFYPETRAFYELEDLWSDSKVTEYKNI